jgi:sporulation protein YlmC with PRC-barrel domain
MDETSMRQKSITVFVGEILGSEIVTAEGKSIGHVADLQLTNGPEYKVTALFFGSRGRLHRWHILAPFAELFGLRFQQKPVSWQAVDQIEHRIIRLKPDQHQPD